MTNICSKFIFPLNAICNKVKIVIQDKYSGILGVIIVLCNYPVTLLIRAPDKGVNEDKYDFSFFSRKTYIVFYH